MIKGDIFLENNEKRIQKAFKFAFPKTLPIFAGFWFLGMSYGILMRVKGFSFVYPLLMSMTIFGGSLEFIAVSMLLSTFCSAPDLSCRTRYTAQTPFLRRFDARKIQRHGLEKALSYLRYVR